jgi:hypothetical protein
MVYSSLGQLARLRVYFHRCIPLSGHQALRSAAEGFLKIRGPRFHQVFADSNIFHWRAPLRSLLRGLVWVELVIEPHELTRQWLLQCILTRRAVIMEFVILRKAENEYYYKRADFVGHRHSGRTTDTDNLKPEI